MEESQMRMARWIIALGIIGLMLSHPFVVFAQTPGVTLKITPSTVKLVPNEETTVLVTLASPLTTPLYEAHLTFTNDPVIQLTFAPIPETLLPQVGYVWQIRLMPTTAFADARTLTARLDYKFESNGVRIPGSALATLDIQPRPPETVDKIAQLRLETTFDAIQENRPGIAYLILTNISDVPLTVEQIAIEHTASVGVQASPVLAAGTMLPPQTSVTAPYTLTAQSRIQPGKSSVLFRVELKWTRDHQISRGTLYAASKFDVAVFGESALTTLFGVPSFLVLPGLLIVVMVRLARRMVNKPWLTDHKSPEFWILAVIISLVAAYVYPLVTANLFGTPLNYLSTYGLGDVLVVWFASLGVGLLAGFLWNGIEWTLGWLYRWLFLPKPTDTPRDVLIKLQRCRAGLILPYALVRVGAHSQRCLVLAQDRLTQAYWVAPLARYRWRTRPQDILLDEFDGALERASSASQMLKLIQRAGEELEIGWEENTAHPIKNPTQVVPSNLSLSEGWRIRLLAESKKGSLPRLPQKDDSVP
jgi:hypothetical protein